MNTTFSGDIARMQRREQIARATQLHELERAFDKSKLGSLSSRPYSYLSVTEVSRHGLPDGAVENVESSPYVQARLVPRWEVQPWAVIPGEVFDNLRG